MVMQPQTDCKSAAAEERLMLGRFKQRLIDINVYGLGDRRELAPELRVA